MRLEIKLEQGKERQKTIYNRHIKDLNIYKRNKVRANGK